MAATAQQVLRSTSGLMAMERAELIDARLPSFDPWADDGMADAWTGEAGARINALDTGS